MNISKATIDVTCTVNVADVNKIFFIKSALHDGETAYKEEQKKCLVITIHMLKAKRNKKE
jgi:hypothetical protein